MKSCRATDAGHPVLQVSRQLAGKCAELVQSQSELRQSHHMLAAAYAANAALQVRFQHVSVLCCAVLCCAVLCCAVLCCGPPVPPICIVPPASPDGLCSCLLVSVTRSGRADHSVFKGLAITSSGSNCCLCLALGCKTSGGSVLRLLAGRLQRLRWAFA